MSNYASFQGRVFLGKRDSLGNPIEVRSPGNVAELKLSLKTDVLEHYESQSGQRMLDHRMVKQKSATIKLTIEEFTKENLALALYGNHVTDTPDDVVGEPVGGAMPVVGERYFLAHPRVSALEVSDSATPPAKLTAGTHYTADLDFGAIQFLETTGFTAPFKASYGLDRLGLQAHQAQNHHAAATPAPGRVDLVRCALTAIDILLGLLDSLCQKFIVAIQRLEAAQSHQTQEGNEDFARRFTMQSNRDIQQNDNQCHNMAAASTSDCRTCGHYLNGQHACDLFRQKGQDCIEGSHWQAAAFAPVWEKAA